MDEIASPAKPFRPGEVVDWETVPDRLLPTRVVPSERAERRRADRGRSAFVKGPLPLG